MTVEYGTKITGTKTQIAEDRPLKVGDYIIAKGHIDSRKYTMFTPKTEPQYLDELKTAFLTEHPEFQLLYAKVQVVTSRDCRTGASRDVGTYCWNTYDIYTEVHAKVVNASPVAPIIIGIICLTIVILAVITIVAVFTYYLVETVKEGVEDISKGADAIITSVGDVFGLKGLEGAGKAVGGTVLVGVVLVIILIGGYILYTGVKKI